MAYTPLRGRSNFKHVFSRGQARRSNGLVLHWAPNGLSENRYAVAAKVAAGRAVTRNRLRRWGRELLRRWDPRLSVGHDLVIIARNREASESFQDFEYHLGQVLRKAELSNNVY